MSASRPPLSEVSSAHNAHNARRPKSGNVWAEFASATPEILRQASRPQQDTFERQANSMKGEGRFPVYDTEQGKPLDIDDQEILSRTSIHHNHIQRYSTYQRSKEPSNKQQKDAASFLYRFASPSSPCQLSASISPSLQSSNSLPGSLSPPHLAPSETSSSAELWREVMAFKERGRIISAPPASYTSIKAPADPPISNTERKGESMFNWTSMPAEFSLMTHEFHWLSALQLDVSSTHLSTIKDLTGRAHLLLPSFTIGFQEDYTAHHAKSRLLWKRLVSDCLFPINGDATNGLLAQLAPEDLEDLQWIPEPLLASKGPDYLYSLTDKIFFPHYQQKTEIRALTEKFAVPYLCVFLDMSMHPGSIKQRADAWATYLLEMKVNEWCRASNMKFKKLLISSSEFPDNSATKQSASIISAKPRGPWQSSKRGEPRPAPPTSSAIPSRQPLPITETLSHYCVAVTPKRFMIWRYEAALTRNTEYIEWREIRCAEFKNHSLDTSQRWEDLAHDILGIHLAAAVYAGKLATKSGGLFRSSNVAKMSGCCLTKGGSGQEDNSVLNAGHKWESATVDEGEGGATEKKERKWECALTEAE